MKPPKHFLSNVDAQSSTGDCLECGPEVPLYMNGKRGWRCKAALQAYQRERNKTRPKRPYDPEKARDVRLKRFYGLTTEQWETMFDSQGRRCAICGTENPGVHDYWATDHDRRCCPGRTSCGVCVRGILCSNCNVGIGHLQESCRILAAACEYLSKQVINQ